jgi:O-antigen/teichoic acid export membrane protein
LIKQISLKKNVIWAIFGNGFFSLAQYLILIFIIKYFGILDTGVYGYALAITNPLFTFFYFQLRILQVVNVKDETKFFEYLQARISSLLLAYVSIFIMGRIFLDDYTFNVVIAVSTFKIIDGVFDIIYGYYQKKERLDYISISNFIRATIMMVSFVAVATLTQNLLMSIYSVSISYLFILIFYEVVFFKKRNEVSKFKLLTLSKLFGILYSGFSLGIVAVLFTLTLNIPKYFIEHFHDKNSVGYFVGISYLISVGIIFVGALGQSVMPRLSKLYQLKDLSNFKKVIHKGLIIAFVIGLLGVIVSVVIGDILLITLYSKEFIVYLREFQIIMIAGLFWYLSWILNYAINSMKIFNIQVFIYILSTIVMLMSSYILIPLMGIKGASYSLLITFIFNFVGFLMLYLYKLRITSSHKIESL